MSSSMPLCPRCRTPFTHTTTLHNVAILHCPTCPREYRAPLDALPTLPADAPTQARLAAQDAFTTYLFHHFQLTEPEANQYLAWRAAKVQRIEAEAEDAIAAALAEFARRLDTPSETQADLMSLLATLDSYALHLLRTGQIETTEVTA